MYRNFSISRSNEILVFKALFDVNHKSEPVVLVSLELVPDVVDVFGFD